MANGSPETDHDDRLNEILLEYVEAVERGQRPDRTHLLNSNPEYAQELASFFATGDRLDQIAAPLRAMAEAGSGWRGDVDATGSASPESAPSESFATTDIGRVGDFRLLREVGHGGMGIVYEAEQVSLRRRVALKVLPFAAAVDSRHLQRFRNEAQAAAQLHHSNIVPVYAVGAEGGVHFYAMQFIEGQSLAQLLAGLREACARTEAGRAGAGRIGSDRLGNHWPATNAAAPEGSPSEPPATIVRAANATVSAAEISTELTSRKRDYFRRVAGLVRQAADALEYAHQVGVVHRDVKPANLLLDGGGRLWVTDFGLAQIRNDTGLTATGELLGTIRYMSPEQALGRPGLVDHRTDIYSLGVTLYELLTLRPAFDGQDRQALLSRIADEEPPQPRAVDRTFPVELETIVLKATAKLPGDRYPHARQFADDLQRFLDDRPVLARRPTLADRAAKWVRRHRGAALAAVLMLTVASICLGVSTAMIARSHAQTKLAYEREREANERERDRALEAEDHYHRTLRAVDLFVELSDEGLLDFPPLAPLRQRLLEAAVAYYQELSDGREDDAVRKELEASQERLTRLQVELAAVNEISTTLLLDQPVIRNDLGLTPEQANRLAPLLDRLKTHQRAQHSEPIGDRRQQIADMAASCRGEVENVLSAAQHRRLRQLLLQLPGPHVFTPAVFHSLGLTDAQKKQVRRIQAEATQASLRRFATAKTPEEGKAQFHDFWKRANEEVVAVLTTAQRERWAEMTGPPAQGEIDFLLPQPDRPR